MWKFWLKNEIVSIFLIYNFLLRPCNNSIHCVELCNSRFFIWLAIGCFQNLLSVTIKMVIEHRNEQARLTSIFPSAHGMIFLSYSSDIAYTYGASWLKRFIQDWIQFGNQLIKTRHVLDGKCSIWKLECWYSFSKKTMMKESSIREQMVVQMIRI